MRAEPFLPGLHLAGGKKILMEDGLGVKSGPSHQSERLLAKLTIRIFTYYHSNTYRAVGSCGILFDIRYRKPPREENLR
jgi:hypothetical protein